MGKYTADEIIEAFGLHLKYSASACDKCPIIGEECERELTGEALDLLKNQNEKIKRLEAKNKILSKNADEVLQKQIAKKR